MKGPSQLLRWARACTLGVTSVTLAVTGHAGGGGHLEPSLIVLLIAASILGAYGWLSAERSLMPIIAWVLGVQVLVHLTLAAGHAHQRSAAMLAAHAASAVLLAGFLRLGEARIFAAARRRYLRWVVAVRLALAVRGAAPRRPAAWSVRGRAVFASRLRTAHCERGPPLTASC